MVSKETYEKAILAVQTSTSAIEDIRKVVSKTKEELQVIAGKHIKLQKEHKELLDRHLSLQQEMLALKQSNKTKYLN